MSKKPSEKISDIYNKYHKLENERLILQDNLDNLKEEFDRLKESPLVGAIFIDFLGEDKDRAIIMSSTGPIFVVKVSNNLKDAKLERGVVVALNQRTFAIMEVLPLAIDELKKVREFYF
ncbi:MAG: hypothetical protein ACFFBI_05815 [Promethearchaeota archaeon]